MRLVSTLIACLAGALVSVGAHSTDITGAGSTFAAPIYTKWADAYQKSGGGRVNYGDRLVWGHQANHCEDGRWRRGTRRQSSGFDILTGLKADDFYNPRPGWR